MTKKGSIKETGEEVSQAEWERFEAAVDVGGDSPPKPRPGAPPADVAPAKAPATKEDPAGRP